MRSPVAAASDGWHASGLSRRSMLGGFGGSILAGSLPAWAETPKRGGRLRISSTSSSSADTLDPAKGGLSTDYVRHFMFYNGLSELNADLTARPGLAETIESSDGQTWTLKLRRGVTFHDGSALTAQDVVFSLQRHRDPETASRVAMVASQIEEVRATGPLEVRVRLSGANADFPVTLAASHFLIVKEGTTDFRTANGTGPYRCRSFAPGVRTLGVRHDGYWKAGRPYLDEMELIGIPDEASRVNALLAGDVHLINAVNPRSTRRIEGTPGFKVLETKSGLYTNLIMRQDSLPTSDPNFVLAIKHLLNRDLIAKAICRGFAVVANDHPIPPGSPYYLPDLPQRAYDPDRAKFLLSKAGLLSARLPVYASAVAEASVDMASLLQESAATIGLRLAVNRVPSDGYWSTHWMRHPMTFGNTNPRPTADLIFEQFFRSSAPWNEAGWKNERFDQLLLAARGERDEARRRQMYGDMQVLIHEQGGLGIPVFLSLIDAYDRRLRGYASIPLGGLMAYTIADREVWWDDAA